MIPKDGRVYKQNTTAMIHYSIMTAISNMVNLYVRGDLHERFMSRFDSSDALFKYEESMKPISEWEISNVISEGSVKAVSPDAISKLADMQTALNSKLSDERVHVANFGAHLLEFIQANKMVTYTGVASSGLAHGMAWLNCPNEPVVMPSPFLIPSPNHPASRQFAVLCAELDRSMFTTKLMSHQMTAAEFDIKDRVSGQQLVTIARAKVPYAISINYGLLLPTLFLDMCWPLWTESLRIQSARSAFWKDTLRIHEEWGSFASKLPRNGFTSMIASLSGNVSAKTIYGEKKLLLDPSGQCPKWRFSKDKQTAGRDEMHRLALCLNDLLRSSINVNWGEWDGEGKSSGQWVDPYSLLAKIGSVAHIEEEMTRIKGILGWQTLSSGTHMIDQIGADFTLSDGEYYSENATDGLLGLKPVIAPNNALATIDDRRNDPFWNGAEVAVGTPKGEGKGRDESKYYLEYSVMFVHGRQSLSGDGSEVERWFMPSNGYVGERDADRVILRTQQEDPMAQVALKYFQSLSSTYICEMYDEPEVVINTNVYLTSWDTWATTANDTGATAYNHLIEAMPDKVKRPADSVPMYRAPWFNMRFITKYARSRNIFHFSPLGSFQRTEKPDGHIEFIGGDVPLNSSGDVLKNILSIGYSAQEARLTEVGPAPVGNQ